jgi:hypothetical protein
MLKLYGKLNGKLDIKRFYPEGMEIRALCPKCNNEYKETNYLSYPKMNEIVYLDCWCPKCEYGWEEKLRLCVSLERISEVYNLKLEDCDTAILNKGVAVCMIDGKSGDVQSLVDQVSKETNTKIDWHYVGGRAVVLTMPENVDTVSHAFIDIFKKHESDIHSAIVYIGGMDTGNTFPYKK